MSDTTGTIVIVVGLAISLVGLYLLARTKRQGLGLLVMIVGFTFCFGWLVLNRLQGQIVEREHDARWLRQLAAEAAR